MFCNLFKSHKPGGSMVALFLLNFYLSGEITNCTVDDYPCDSSFLKGCLGQKLQLFRKDFFVFCLICSMVRSMDHAPRDVPTRNRFFNPSEYMCSKTIGISCCGYAANTDFE